MATQTTPLRVDLQEGDRWRRTLQVTVPASRVEEERSRILRQLATRIKMPGFRSGKIPARVVEERFGGQVRQQTLDKVIGDAYKEALRQEDLRPISEGEIEKVDYEPEGDLVFAVAFDVQPQVDISRLGGFVVERPAMDVTDAEVDQVLERLRDQNAVWEPAEEGVAEPGDLAAVEVLRLDPESGEPEGEAQSYELVLGEGDAIPDVESAIATLAPGEEGTFTVRFPDDFPNEARRGEEQRLKVTLKGRRLKRLPELDDAFARSVGDFEDLDALKARVREDLEREAAEQVEGAVRGRLLELIVEANPFEVPRSMAESYLESVLGDTSEADPERVAEAREQLRPEAERAVKRILVIERVAETQGLRATEEEVDARIQEIAEKNDSTPAQVYARLQKAGRIDALEREITETKVFDFLKGKSEIQDER